MSELVATWIDWTVLSAAGALAGAVNTVAGGGSLISFPALLALGYSPLTANVTNAVATVPGYVGGCIGFRAEVGDQATELRRLGSASVLGALTGSALLLSLPADGFRAIVGWLVLGSTVLMLVQPWIRRAIEAAARSATGHPVPARPLWVFIAQFVVAVYGGYFAAGLGVLMLAVLGTLRPNDLQQLNALKSGLSLVIGFVSAMFFAVNASVAWVPALILAIFSLVGGLGGARLARAISPEWLRRIVIAVGFGAAIVLLTRN
jgi:uncharacterized protein